MKKNSLRIVLIAFILIAAAIYLISRQSNSTLRSGEDNFAVKDTARITKVFLADKQDRQILLTKSDDGLWLVNDSIEALQEKVNTLLKTIRGIDVQRPVSNKAHNGVVSRLAARSTKVEIYQKAWHINLFGKIKLFPYEKNSRTYYVGGATQEKTGTFVLMEDAERPYVVGIPGFRGYISTRFTARLADWRHHVIFESKINEIKSLEIAFGEQPEQSFRIENIDNRMFKLKQLENNRYISQFDTVKVIEYLTAYRNIRFEHLLNNSLPQHRIDSIRSQEPAHIITLKRHDGEQQEVRTHYMPSYGRTDLDGNPLPHNPDKMYAFINDGADVVTVQFFVFDKLLKPVGYFTGDYRNRVAPNFERVM